MKRSDDGVAAGREGDPDLPALGDPTRYRIVRVLMERGEVPCQDLSKLFPLSAPALSHHCRVLQECGLMQVRKNGPYHVFRLDRWVLDEVAAAWGRAGG